MPATEEAICVSRGEGRRAVRRGTRAETYWGRSALAATGDTPGRARVPGKPTGPSRGTHRHASQAPQRLSLVGLAVPLLVVVCFGHGGRLEGRGGLGAGGRGVRGGRRVVTRATSVEGGTSRPLSIRHRDVIGIRLLGEGEMHGDPRARLGGDESSPRKSWQQAEVT